MTAVVPTVHEEEHEKNTNIPVMIVGQLISIYEISVDGLDNGTKFIFLGYCPGRCA